MHTYCLLNILPVPIPICFRLYGIKIREMYKLSATLILCCLACAIESIFFCSRFSITCSICNLTSSFSSNKFSRSFFFKASNSHDSPATIDSFLKLYTIYIYILIIIIISTEFSSNSDSPK